MNVDKNNLVAMTEKRAKKINEIVDLLIDENIEAFQELAKY